MTTINTAIAGVVILEPEVFEDERGTFCETFSERELGLGRFVQDNQSTSRRGVVRGLHFQRPPHAQAKLVRCVTGRILDVAVDMRSGSSSFGKWVAVELSGENRRQLFVPRGFAHGFCALEDAVVAYKCDEYYAPQAEGGVLWNDPQLAIDWGIDPAQAIVSEKDAALPLFEYAYKF